MKRGSAAILVLVLIGLLGAVVLYSGVSSPTGAAPTGKNKDKVEICHFDKKALTYTLLSLKEKAAQKHLDKHQYPPLGGDTTDLTKCLPSGTCGNGAQEGSEQCDGADAAACGAYPCNADCTCQSCGDGVKNGAEQCEPGQPGQCGAGYNCIVGQCQCEMCGDGMKNGNEECDGNDAADCPGNCQGDCACPGGGGGGQPTCADKGGVCAVTGEQSCILAGGTVFTPPEIQACPGIGEICCKPGAPPEPTPTATPTTEKDPCPTNNCLLPAECNGFKQVGTVCDPLICCIPAATPTPTQAPSCPSGQCAVVGAETCVLNGGTVLPLSCPNVGEICCQPGSPTPTPTQASCTPIGEMCSGAGSTECCFGAPCLLTFGQYICAT